MPVPAPSPDARAVVTGASQNIGAALATELAARGHSLIVTARREDLLTDLAARLADKYRRRRGSATRRSGRPGANGRSCATNWPPAPSRSCAPTRAPRPSVRCRTLDPAGEKAQVQLNAIAVHDLTLAVLPGMIERKAGGILISGSAAGNSPIPVQRHLCGHQSVRQHFQRIVARRTARLGCARHAAGAGPGAHRSAR